MCLSVHTNQDLLIMEMVDHSDRFFNALKFLEKLPAKGGYMDNLSIFKNIGFLDHIAQGNFRRPPERKITFCLHAFVNKHVDCFAGIQVAHGITCHNVDQSWS